MSKLKQNKINDILKIAIEQGVIENQFNWKLTREGDGKTCQSKEIMWLDWDEEGKFKSKYSDPAVGRSLIMSPFNEFFTWQTTDIKEILEQSEDYVKFKTNNSIYELCKISSSDSAN